MTTPAPPEPPPLATTTPPLQRTRSEFSLPVRRPRALTKQHSIDSEPATSPSVRQSILSTKPIRATSATHKRHEDTLLTEQFERMMDRFQLRRVALPRTLSSSSTAVATTQRDTARVTPYAPAALPPKPSHWVAGRKNDAIREHHPDSAFAGEPPSSRTAAIGWLLRPTGWQSQTRLVFVTVVFVAQLAYFPFVLVYARADNALVAPWIEFDLFADAAFLGSVVLLCNTATNTVRGQPVTTRRAILRQYRRRGLLLDVLPALPLELLCTRTSWGYGASLLVQLSLRGAAVRRQWHQFQLVWADAMVDQEEQQTWVDWLLYSRFGHLVRIGRLVIWIILLAHYLACVWTFLRVPVNSLSKDPRPALAVHLHSIYDVLQMLQGQGVTTTSVAQDVFGSFAVLLGSIALAVVFGHVAVLVANFTANRTAYQRKMERVFAIMGKLQLPNPIRERVHQYYEYLHAEYESLDGDVVKFAKDLSHTLELEVVLFKYMDVFMQVPHWRGCSPDFQKQLVLNLTVRVYLPDDFIIRRGEVGTSCFVISRGVCQQYAYPGGNDEPSTPPLLIQEPELSSSTRRGSTRLSDLRYSTPSVARGNESTKSTGEGYNLPTTLARGQAVGEKALIANYARSSDVRAFTYVEMCVLERETFQRMLTRYPHDRRVVLTNIVRQAIQQRALQGLECEMMATVHRAAPFATAEEGVVFVVEAMSPPVCDPSILFGATDHFERELLRVAGRSHARGGAQPLDLYRIPQDGSVTALTQQVEQLQTQLNRIELVLQSLVARASGEPGPTTSATSAATQGRSYQHVVQDKTTTRKAGIAKVVPLRASSYRVARLYRRASETLLLRLPVVRSSTHTAYADKLFQAERVAVSVRPDTMPRSPL